MRSLASELGLARGTIELGLSALDAFPRTTWGAWHVVPCQPGGLLLGFTNIEDQEAAITLAQKLWDALKDVQRKSHSFHFFNTPIY